MKKILFFIILVNLLTLNSFSAEIMDCSKYSKLSTEYYKCKTNNLIKDAKNYTNNLIENTKNYQDKKWSEEKSKLDTAKKKLKDAKKKVLD
tara:strand:- start:290 stop:562 length:273 start_codon:yes stop_codon:yes gene_type:complete